MKLSTLPRLALILSALSLLGFAAGCSKSETPAPAKTTAAPAAGGGQLLAAKTAATPEWLAKEIAAYPLTTCTVSGDKLGGSMGPTLDYVWRVAGQPDRLVRFCCNDCLADFEKNPAKFLAMIDTAKAKK
jgi:hypothetical protein